LKSAQKVTFCSFKNGFWKCVFGNIKVQKMATKNAAGLREDLNGINALKLTFVNRVRIMRRVMWKTRLAT